MNNQRWLSASFFAFFFTWGIFLPYWTGWLTLEKGLSVSGASVIMGVGMAARALTTFLVFPALTRRASLRTITQWLAAVSLVFAVLYIPESPVWVLAAVTILFSAIYPMSLPAAESGATLLMQTERIHYGRSRSFGSIGYTAALLLVGAATSVWGEQSILYLMIAGLAAALLFYTRPAPAALRTVPKRTENDGGHAKLRTLFRTKGFFTITVLAVLLQGAHAAYYSFGFIYLDDLGVSGIWIGVILNVAVLFEIVFFRVSDRLLANVKTSTMFLIAGIGSTVRWFLVFLFPITPVFVLSQTLHAISFGVAHYAFVHYISSRLPKQQIAPAQGMYAAFAMSLSTAVLTVPAGYLYDFSPGLAFLGMAVCTIPAVLIVLATRNRLHY
ncbi:MULTISPECIES: 3-phenylpropionate MFS transporter [Sporosarcina]|uniref:3-phenylpropionate MFS transporter n=1 Tax=Sporosarcina TaxID=1569 RepID=UPI00058E1650|nr:MULTISPECIES: 3-phenylpropionate MFS transporter [Sporosarcina]WJY27158.1 3-phenylpropionate MFS transporter [Sporosarcina sp. 0.2-SM1T-5]